MNPDPAFHDQYVSTENARALQYRHIENGEIVFQPTIEEARTHHALAMSELTDEQKAIGASFPAIEVK